ncbi:MAG: DNA repair protein RadA [Oscillospiraceae bacterium]|jgi:DNA repair protein RadA/Sms|nr:DNA repair protein RadA [Oscillospiraceae bacterium]
MPKPKSLHICTACGHETAKWFGQCPGCGEWNTLEEHALPANTPAKRTIGAGGGIGMRQALRLHEIPAEGEQRYDTGIGELNRVLGGGLVRGSLVLLSGDPGIGKSTLSLQICGEMGGHIQKSGNAKGLEILYVSGEESAHQLKLRAARLGVDSPALSVLCETDAQGIIESIRASKPGLVLIDSIQTMQITEIASSPGSVTQVRECTNLFLRTAKALNIPCILIGHVNKDGNIAGPKVLEHVVDAVLYFEGERHLSYRILRAVKNRYGSTNEIGVFEMSDTGLREVENPSEMLLSGRSEGASGSCVACVLEGSRPLLAEVQALVSETGFGNPRRMVNGFDANRMNMLIAVLEKRAGRFFGNMDAYLNIAGGLKLDEPACDLPVALALASGLQDTAIAQDALAFGELGLGGEIRAVSGCEQRLREAARLGFGRCIIPRHNFKSLTYTQYGDLVVLPARNIREAMKLVGLAR